MTPAEATDIMQRLGCIDARNGVWVLYSEYPSEPKTIEMLFRTERSARIEMKRRKSSAYGVVFMPFGKHIWEVV